MRLKLGIAILGLASLGLLVLPSAHADEWNKLTYLTFNGPVEIPGKVLPAGTYAFKLFDSSSNRSIVEIFDQDQTQLYAIVMGVPEERDHVTGKTVVWLSEPRATQSPEAIRAWFYPGDNTGLEFVYPERQAVQLANANQVAVLAMPDHTSDNVQSLKSASITTANPTR
jgi:hypothetical protein